VLASLPVNYRHAADTTLTGATTAGTPPADCTIDQVVALVAAGETMHKVQMWNKKLRDAIRRALSSADQKAEHAESAAESEEIHKTLTLTIKKAIVDRTRVPFLREQRAAKDAQSAARKQGTAEKQAAAKNVRDTATLHTPRGDGKARIGDSTQARANAAGKDTRMESACRFWRTGMKGGHGFGCTKEGACPYAHNPEWAAGVKAKHTADLAAAAARKSGGKRKRAASNTSAAANNNDAPTQPPFQTAHQHGRVVRSEADRGFYIIAADKDGAQIFCHTRGVVGVDKLAEDDRVRFQLTKNDKRKDGHEATNVTVTVPAGKKRAVSVHARPGASHGRQGGKGR